MVEINAMAIRYMVVNNKVIAHHSVPTRIQNAFTDLYSRHRVVSGAISGATAVSFIEVLHELVAFSRDARINKSLTFGKYVLDQMMDWSGADPIYPALAGLLIGAAAGYHKEEKAILHEAMLKEQTYSESLMKSKNELEEVVRIKNMFVTMVAHDLRSPLSGAAELLRLVLSEEIDEAEYKSNLEMIADSLDHTVKLVGNILDLERFRGGHLNINKERFDVSSVVSRTAYLFLPVAEPKGIKISGLIEPETFFWKADIELISEVISNLVSNALKYIPKGKNGNIEISQSKTDPLVLVVKDNGKGMSPARLRHVLESDMIGSSLGTSGEKGTGLGLSFCKEIIKAHGGRLWAESTEGEGTTFYIKLPPS